MKLHTFLALVGFSWLTPSLPGQVAAPVATDKNGVLVRYTPKDGQFAVTFRVPDARYGIKVDGISAQSYIRIDVDTEYTETVTWTDYASPVTVSQLKEALDKAIVKFRHTEPDQTIKGQHFPARTYDVSIVSRRDITVASQAGLEITADDNYLWNGYFRVFPMGDRLYLMSAVTQGSEQADDATDGNKIEAERFFNSFSPIKP